MNSPALAESKCLASAKLLLLCVGCPGNVLKFLNLIMINKHLLNLI